MRSFLKKSALTAAMCLGLASGAQAATVDGEFWDTSAGFSSIADVLAYIAGARPTATFTSTGIDYPNGAEVIADSTTLSDFLGADAASLSGSGSTDLEYSVFRFTGLVDLAAGLHTFMVGSDDGFRLSLDGTPISEHSAPRAFGTTTVDYTVAGGPTAFELVYYENYGVTGVEFRIDGELVGGVAPIPLPATLPLMVFGLGFSGFALRKRKAG